MSKAAISQFEMGKNGIANDTLETIVVDGLEITMAKFHGRIPKAKAKAL